MPSDGGEIIEAWLTYLETAQPSHGSLLTRTVEAVGPPPAVTSGGAIVTIGEHLEYWSAVGFTQSYAGSRADRFRIKAWLDYSDAENAGDEQKMVRDLARARFWESVRDWVQSVDPLPLRPETEPAWLAALSREPT